MGASNAGASPPPPPPPKPPNEGILGISIDAPPPPPPPPGRHRREVAEGRIPGRRPAEQALDVAGAGRVSAAGLENENDGSSAAGLDDDESSPNRSSMFIFN